MADDPSLSEKKFKAEHMIYFEMGLILLDANIRYLLHLYMYTGPYYFLNVKALK